MDMNGIRKTHPNPQKIGKRFAGDPCVLLFLFMIKMESSLGLWP
ncbi:hypothetical protein CGLO_12039 [Colletotrichum gloeosporioides Cg-14]|uniref:Uncharacterized protein n=1 Tax=Colletotrichum gloeosporioides (strain Cg-14) TaxID=1237896 RepID=T0K6W8_COLGC|nr:hypothetical protein CGLO_12039 [Colletotrichum gloeosporioides Cg-14]